MQDTEKCEKYEFAPIWCEILKIYDVVRDICERHQLNYYAAFGTLIGAVRHSGFIPWDDDFDLWMPRSDYTCFMRFAQKEMPNKLVWQSVETDKSYHYLFGKVRLADEERVSVVSRMCHLSLKQGIYIDIFPLDGLPSGNIGRFFWCVKRGLFRRGLSKWFCGIPVGRAKNHYLKFSEWYASRRYEDSKFVGGVSGYSDAKMSHRWCFPKEWFSSSEEVPFEDRKVRIPVGAKKILTAIYGDYMQLPPEAARVPSHQVLESRLP